MGNYGLDTNMDLPPQELVEQDFQLYCDHCNQPTLRPEHAHYRCSNCGQRTSCCEGM